MECGCGMWNVGVECGMWVWNVRFRECETSQVSRCETVPLVPDCMSLFINCIPSTSSYISALK